MEIHQTLVGQKLSMQLQQSSINEITRSLTGPRLSTERNKHTKKHGKKDCGYLDLKLGSDEMSFKILIHLKLGCITHISINLKHAVQMLYSRAAQYIISALIRQ